MLITLGLHPNKSLMIEKLYFITNFVWGPKFRFWGPKKTDRKCPEISPLVCLVKQRESESRG